MESSDKHAAPEEPTDSSESVPTARAEAIAVAAELSEPKSDAPDFERGMDEAFAACYPNNPKLLLEVFEKAVIQRMLAATDGNQAEAAKVLGITRATLKKRIDSYDL